MKINGLNRAAEEIKFGINEGDDLIVLGLHPDDISAFYAGAIKQARRAGARVHTIVATDGEKSTKGPQAFVSKGLRRREAIAEAAILGIPVYRQHYLGMPDIAYYNDTDARSELQHRFTEVLTTVGPAAILTPGAAGVDGHPAHSAGHEMMIEARNTLGSSAIIWGLTAEGDGQLPVPVDQYLKFLAIAQNSSQFPNTIRPNGTIEFTEFARREMAAYVMNGLMEVEYYDRY